GLERARLAAEPETPLAGAASRRFGEMIRRRLRREPVAYILGRKGFRRIELEVDRRVLVPRPETELLVEVALELAPATVLDTGTGSGAVALAIADELPAALVTAADSSEEALAVARGNAERLGAGARVSIVAGTLPGGHYDLLVANLPYVAEAEWEGLAPEIREHEPAAALVAGPTGLESIAELLALVREAGEPPAAIALEVGEGQGGDVARIVGTAGYEHVGLRADLAGIERVVVGRR
ncbi:MAG: peptide chain release factor N(5)-glutamine methyltransferase, partial [Actinomycetota bacterium]|nr:peptide chain release factor N(5)-glutamine methyltransferase [Actinomycetota bacterium]